ncbi:hypothetical protein [Sulfurimonas sp.]|uniref:hypothetical protein n=1 Tax=Sulfurimonas sp. TaxID=2022749 RepID=UPI002AB250ED|nr:hypothetical protein [Sulfurimonas sp.]
MSKLNLPHKAPVRFAQEVIYKELDKDIAVVSVKFDSLPSLAMIVEAAAQSSAAFGGNDKKMGFLVSLKNIKLLEELKSLDYYVEIFAQHQLAGLSYFNFKVFIKEEKEKVLANGTFIIALL